MYQGYQRPHGPKNGKETNPPLRLAPSGRGAAVLTIGRVPRSRPPIWLPPAVAAALPVRTDAPPPELEPELDPDLPDDEMVETPPGAGADLGVAEEPLPVDPELEPELDLPDDDRP